MFLLAGIMLFSIGIDQSFAQSVPVTANGAVLDLSDYNTIAASCLGESRIDYNLKAVPVIFLGTLVQSPALCFEGTHGFDIYILNAEDEVVVKSKINKSTSGVADKHFIGMSNLESNTDYRAVLLLTGAYSANPGTSPYVDNTTVYRITPFSTFPAVDDALDLSEYDTINPLCLRSFSPAGLGETRLNVFINSLKSPSCFEDSTRTWQALLLNAEDDVIVKSTITRTVFTVGFNQIEFTGLEPDTDYKLVLLLTGAYSANPRDLANNPYVTSTVSSITGSFSTAVEIGTELDLSGYAKIDTSCLTADTVVIDSGVISGSLGALAQSQAQCFEGDTRTWQAYILNADDNVVVKSKASFTTSELRDSHSINFNGLEPDTDYRRVLLLTGAYSANPADLANNPYVTSTVYRIIPDPPPDSISLAIGDPLDYTVYTEINESCLQFFSISSLDAQSIDVIPGTINQSPAPCFEDSTRTWQGFILNAVDDVIVHSTDPVTTSSFTSSAQDQHRINFDALGPETDYKVAWLLTGAYSANPADLANNPYVTSTVYRIIPYSISDSTSQVIGDVLDYTVHNEIHESCLRHFNTVSLDAQSIDVTPGTVNQFPTPCFEDSTHTWQGFILNAVDNTIVYSTDLVTASSVQDPHRINFNALEPETNYKVVWILSGAYSANPADLTNNPYVDTTVYEISSFTTTLKSVGDELDLSEYHAINASCLRSQDSPSIDSTRISGPLGELTQSPAPCFEGNTRTWNGFILNAENDIVVNFEVGGTTSSLDDVHRISFHDLEHDTDYRAVLLLSGAYSANPADLNANPYVDTSVFISYPFTTFGLEYAPDITLQALTGSAGTLAISFKQLLDNQSDIHYRSEGSLNLRIEIIPDYDTSDITLSLQTADASIYDSITGVTGVTVDPGNTGSTDTFIVNEDIVTISTTLDNTYNSDIHFDYTVTDSTGGTDTGVLTITFVDVISNIIAIPHTFTEGSFGYPSLTPTLQSRISPHFFTALFVSEFNANQLSDAVDGVALTTTGIGNASGTLSFTPSIGFGRATTFEYTPTPGFVGTETFPYTATFDGMKSSSVIKFVVSTRVGGLDVSEHANIDTSCLGANTVNPYSFAIVGSLGALSTTPCFEGNMHTWQAYILNAEGAIIVDSSDPVTTSNILDIHEIDFNGLKPDTNYRAVLSLTGAYNGGSGSYTADTTVFSIHPFTTLALPVLDNTLPAVGDELDLSGYANLNIFCTSRVLFDVTPIGVTGSLGTLDSPRLKCFEDNLHTWQAYILNADDTIVYSTDPVITASLVDVHRLDFKNLEPETDYRLVLLLSGAYSASPSTLEDNPYTAGTSVFGIYPFTTPELEYAPDITLQALTASAGTLTIPFSDLLDNPVDIHYRSVGSSTNSIPAYVDLDIIFSLQTADASIYDSITGVTGVTVNPGNTASTAPFIVNADTVTISTGLDNMYNSDIHFDYIVADENGNTDTGVLTITFVDTIQNIVAIPYTFTNAISPPMYEGVITPYLFTALFVTAFDINQLNDAVNNIVLTTTGTGDAAGTLDLIHSSSPTPHVARFTYTPDSEDFIGTETFPYTATFDGMTSSSVINFVTTESVCAASLRSGVNFGTLDVGETSDIQFISALNDGTENVQLFMKGENWKSDTDGVDTMNVGQTRYTATGNHFESYADRTPLTSTPTNLGFVLEDTPLSFALQLHMDLLNDSFRGVTSQELTLSSVCDDGSGTLLPAE